ncbi:MAG TPA: hypothetical protein ENK57_01695 [Polyangiaceae bacterium]|nr:hypothetical protein [Polyangiaceae bacterium]
MNWQTRALVVTALVYSGCTGQLSSLAPDAEDGGGPGPADAGALDSGAADSSVWDAATLDVADSSTPPMDAGTSDGGSPDGGLAPSVPRVIFDTDMAWDWDDVGAMATLHALADRGEVEILGMSVCTGGTAGEWNPHTLDIINTYYGRPDLPIGLPRRGVNVDDNYGEWLVSQGFPHELDSTEDAVDLYRRLLAEQPDHSVVLISVGYLNNYNDLLLSEPDGFSDLNGRDLIARKVVFWSAMAGVYPGRDSEANLQDWHGYARNAVEDFPVPILFTSTQAGDFETGAALLDTPPDNPIRAIYEHRQAQVHPATILHPTFDQVAVLVAVRDVTELFEPTVSGTNRITLDGENRTFNEWLPSPDSGHRYFTHRDRDVTRAVIDGLMAAAPR